MLESEKKTTKAVARPKGKILAITGAIFQIGPVIGLMGTVIGMVRAFGMLANDGISDPRALSGAISEVLVMTFAGLVVGIIGIVLCIIAATACRYRAQWFFWYLVIYGILLVFSYPYGTPLGLLLLVYCLAKEKEFFPRCPATPLIPNP